MKGEGGGRGKGGHLPNPPSYHDIYCIVGDLYICRPREYLMNYGGTGFLAVGSSPPPPPTRQKVSLSLAVFLFVAGAYRRGGGAGEEPNHTTARKPGPQYVIHCALCRRDQRSPPSQISPLLSWKPALEHWTALRACGLLVHWRVLSAGWKIIL